MCRQLDTRRAPGPRNQTLPELQQRSPSSRLQIKSSLQYRRRDGWRTGYDILDHQKLAHRLTRYGFLAQRPYHILRSSVYIHRHFRSYRERPPSADTSHTNAFARQPADAKPPDGHTASQHANCVCTLDQELGRKSRIGLGHRLWQEHNKKRGSES